MIEDRDAKIERLRNELKQCHAENERLHEEIGHWSNIVFDMGAEIEQLRHRLKREGIG